MDSTFTPKGAAYVDQQTLSPDLPDTSVLLFESIFLKAVEDADQLSYAQKVFVQFKDYPLVKHLIRAVMCALNDNSRFFIDSDSIHNVTHSPNAVDVCLLRNVPGTERTGHNVVLAVRAAPPSVMLSTSTVTVRGPAGWWFLCHECFEGNGGHCGSMISEVAKDVERALKEQMGPMVLSDAIQRQAQQIALTRVPGFPTCLIDEYIRINLRPVLEKLVEMNIRLQAKGMVGSVASTEDMPRLVQTLRNGRTVFFSGASGSGKTAAMFALLKRLEDYHAGSNVCVVGLSCRMDEVTWKDVTVVADTVAAHVVKRLVECIGEAPTDGRSTCCVVGNLRVVLLVDEAGSDAAHAQALGAASLRARSEPQPQLTALHKAFITALGASLRKNKWVVDPIDPDAVSLNVFAAGTGVGREFGEGCVLPLGVLMADFHEATPCEVLRQKILRSSTFDTKKAKEVHPTAVQLITALIGEPILKLFATTNLRCGALLGEHMVKECRHLPPDSEVKDYVRRNLLSIIEKVSDLYLGCNGFAFMANSCRAQLARLIVSLHTTAPMGYHLLTPRDVNVLVHTVGAVEDCASVFVPEQVSLQGEVPSVLLVTGSDDVAGMPAYGTPCFPAKGEREVVYLLTDRATPQKLRLRVGPAMLLVSISVLGQLMPPSAEADLPAVHERILHTMAESLAVVHAQAAKRHFAHAPEAGPINVPASTIWTWLPNECHTQRITFRPDCCDVASYRDLILNAPHDGGVRPELDLVDSSGGELHFFIDSHSGDVS